MCFFFASLFIAGCSPRTEAECLMEVSKHAQSDKAAVLGKIACDKQFPDAHTKQSSLRQNEFQLQTLRPGDVVDGYVFKGGDPSQQQNWTLQAFDVNERKQIDLIEKVHPNWIEKINTPDFINWLDTQTDDIKSLVDSDKASDAIRMLDLFEQSKIEAANESK